MKLIGDVLKRNAKLFPGKPGVAFESKILSFAELNRMANQISHGLLQLEVNKDDCVLFIDRNSYQWVAVYFGLAKSGAVYVPLNYMSNEGDILHWADYSEAVAIIFGSGYLKIIESVRPQLDGVRHLICINHDEIKLPESVIDFDTFFGSMPSTEPNHGLDETDTYMIVQTTGSTGRPKGIIATHRHHLKNCINQVIEMDVHEDDITLNLLPLTSIPEQLLPHFYVGATCVVLPKFDPKLVFETIEKEKITNFDSVPTILRQLLEFPDIDHYDHSSLRTIWYGSAPMPLSTLRQWMERFPKVDLIQLYGQGEAGVLVTILKPHDHQRKMGSVGREMVNVEMRIVDDNGRDVPPGQVGEIICKSESIMKGYFKMPEETERVIKDGWLYTGDLGRFDHERFVYLVDRKKEIIISGGFNVAAIEVEEVLCSHPAVKEAAVIGIPDPKWGEAVRGIVALKEGQKITDQELIAYCKGRLAGYKCPKGIDLMDELPKTEWGKIHKKVLKDKFRALGKA